MSTLKVDAIRSSGGSADGLTMDSSGRVFTPARPAFHAYDASGPAHIELAHGSWGIVPFDTTSINTGGHYNTSSYRFTAPVAGLYFFYIQLYMDKAGGVRYCALYKNGAGHIALSQTQSNTDDDGTATATRIIELSVNDYIEPYYFHGTDTASSFFSNGDGIYSYFMGYLIG